jgi:hypothetical protein
MDGGSFPALSSEMQPTARAVQVSPMVTMIGNSVLTGKIWAEVTVIQVALRRSRSIRGSLHLY